MAEDEQADVAHDADKKHGACPICDPRKSAKPAASHPAGVSAWLAELPVLDAPTPQLMRGRGYFFLTGPEPAAGFFGCAALSSPIESSSSTKPP